MKSKPVIENTESDKGIGRVLLRPAEAFKIAAVGKSTGYGLIASGQWPAIRIGKAIRIPVEGLRAWVERQIAEQTEGR